MGIKIEKINRDLQKKNGETKICFTAEESFSVHVKTSLKTVSPFQGIFKLNETESWKKRFKISIIGGGF